MKMIDIILKEDEHLEEVLLLHRGKIAVHLAKMVCWAMSNNLDSFSFAKIHVEGEEEHTFELGCKREDYLEALRKQLKNLIEFEEYELCPEVEEWIGYLEAEEKLGL